MARDLNDTLIFAKVVEQGSFTAAARTLGFAQDHGEPEGAGA